MFRAVAPTIPTAEQLQTILSNNPPPTEAVTPAAGAGTKAARDDHKHPRLSSAVVTTLGPQGEVDVVFTRSFSVMPAVNCLLIETPDNQPVVFKVKSWARSGPDYIGCTIKGYRMQTLPPVLTLLTQLLSFNIAGGQAAGAQFCCVAIQPSS